MSNKLAACVNIIPGLVSIYEWEGKVNEDEEVLVPRENFKNLFVFTSITVGGSDSELGPVRNPNQGSPWWLKLTEKFQTWLGFGTNCLLTEL